MPVIPPRLTVKDIKQAVVDVTQTGRSVQLSDAVVIGLRVRISGTTGRVTYAYAWKDQTGRTHKSRVAATNLDAARKIAAGMREQSLAGVDINDERRIRRAQEGDTLVDVLNRYKEQVSNKKRSWVSLDKAIRHVFARHLDKPFEGLTVRSLQHTIDAHPGTQACGTAVRAFKPFVKWAARHVDRFPSRLNEVQAPPKNAPRERTLTVDELEVLVPYLRDGKGGIHGKAMLFMLLTLGRLSEVCEARWGDIGLSDWTIPRNKSNVKHVVPLSIQALLVMPERKADDGDLVFPSRQGTRLGNWDRTVKAMLVELNSGEIEPLKWRRVKHFTRHDLRRTAAHCIAEQGYLPHVVESALGHVHVHSPLASVYARARYQVDVRAALDWWGGVLLGDITEHGRWASAATGGRNGDIFGAEVLAVTSPNA
jgi:integrase